MMKYKVLLIAALWLTGILNSFSQENWPNIGPGINLDFSPTEVNKVGYDQNYYEAFQSAGFESVRLFVRHGNGPEYYKDAVDDALTRGLTVVLVAFSTHTNGKENFVNFWKNYAEFYKMYPKELVFELMNEPEMAGHPNAEELSKILHHHPWTDAQAKVVMDWIGEAVIAVRATNPTRLLAIGGVGHNNVQYLKYVSAEYLDYKLPDGTGFNEDKNIWGVFHLYRPMGFSHSPDYVKLEDVNPKWKKEVSENLDTVVKWSEEHGKKAFLTEWGTRMYNDHKDIQKYSEYMVEQTKKRDIDWMYYCGVFNNSWPFALYSSESGFEETEGIVEALTGVVPTVVPPTNQINNSTIDLDVDHWQSTHQISVASADGQGVNGSRAMRVQVSFIHPEKPAVFQQTPSNWQWKTKGGMIQLRKGNTYKISFYAKAAVNKTKLGVELGVAPDNETILYTSEKVAIDTELTKYEFTYKHETETVDDARFSIFFTERHSEIILDDIKMSGTRPEYRPKL